MIMKVGWKGQAMVEEAACYRSLVYSSEFALDTLWDIVSLASETNTEYYYIIRYLRISGSLVRWHWYQNVTLQETLGDVLSSCGSNDKVPLFSETRSFTNKYLVAPLRSSSSCLVASRDESSDEKQAAKNNTSAQCLPSYKCSGTFEHSEWCFRQSSVRSQLETILGKTIQISNTNQKHVRSCSILSWNLSRSSE